MDKLEVFLATVKTRFIRDTVREIDGDVETHVLVGLNEAELLERISGKLGDRRKRVAQSVVPGSLRVLRVNMDTGQAEPLEVYFSSEDFALHLRVVAVAACPDSAVPDYDLARAADVADVINTAMRDVGFSQDEQQPQPKAKPFYFDGGVRVAKPTSFGPNPGDD